MSRTLPWGLLLGGLALVLWWSWPVERKDAHSVNPSGSQVGEEALEPGGSAGRAEITTRPFSQGSSIDELSKEREERLQDHLSLRGVESNVPTDSSARIFGKWSQRGAPRRRHHVQAVRLSGNGNREARVLAVTDTSGMYELHVRPGRYELGFEATTYPVTVASSESRRLDHDDTGRAEVLVHLHGEGFRKDGADVILDHLGPDGSRWRPRAATDRLGVARFPSVPRGRIKVRAGLRLLGSGSSVPVEAEALVPAQASVVDVHLEPPRGSLTLSINDPEGRALSGVSLEIRPQSGGRRRVVTDARERVHFPLIPPGDVRVVARHPEYAVTHHVVSVADGPKVEDLRLEVGRTLKVAVTNERGQPLRHILRARLADPAQDRTSCGWECALDDRGAGALTQLPPRPLTLEFFVDSHEPLTRAIDPRSKSPTILVLSSQHR